MPTFTFRYMKEFGTQFINTKNKHKVESLLRWLLFGNLLLAFRSLVLGKLVSYEYVQPYLCNRLKCGSISKLYKKQQRVQQW